MVNPRLRRAALLGYGLLTSTFGMWQVLLLFNRDAVGKDLLYACVLGLIGLASAVACEPVFQRWRQRKRQ